jgi:PilZ domain
MTAERRQFPRLQAPVLCRPAGLLLRILKPRQSVDVSLGGIRIFSDEPAKVGSLLDLELFVSDHQPFSCTAEVVWVEELAPGAPALYDVGLRFTKLTPQDRERLALVLEK